MSEAAKVLSRRSRRSGNLSTIIDVARLANVSTATVSRYLNNPDIVAAESRERVKAAIAELNYVPNALAGGLASSSTQTVAVFAPHLADSIIAETMDNLLERLSQAGTVPLLGLTGLDPVRTEAALMAALSRRVSAVITTGSISDRLRTLLRNSGTMVIEMWGLPRDPVDIAIGFSHVEVGRALGRFAHEHGYRRPHLVTAMGPRAQWRRYGFLEVWSDLGLEPPTDDEVPIPSNYGHAPELFRRLQQLPHRPDLIVTGSDILAHGLIMQAHKAGLHVPRDLAVIGFGDLSLATAVEPALTTVRIDGVKIADKVLEAIAARRSGGTIPCNRIDCGFEIVRRESA